MTRKLVLFDVDGTLIRDDGIVREAYLRALQSVYGFSDSLDDYDFSGRTDPEITFMVLEGAGYDDDQIRAGLTELWSSYLGNLRASVHPSRVRLLPGVVPLLDALSRCTDVTLALLTGNIEPGARMKLETHDLNRYFRFGAFGSDSADRTRLPPIAVERAREVTGYGFRGAEVVVIGDSVYDVRCGVPHQATTIAVASGRTPYETLASEQPSHLFHSLEEVDLLLEAIGTQ